jgi:hypothetical protein
VTLRANGEWRAFPFGPNFIEASRALLPRQRSLVLFGDRFGAILDGVGVIRIELEHLIEIRNG